MHRERSSVGLASIAMHALACLVTIDVAHASSAWMGASSDIPPAASAHVYGLDELLKIALEINPKAGVAREQAAQASMGIDLAQSAYAPQVDIDALGGVERTPLTLPHAASPKGYFISDSREFFPAIAMKWLLFDFGRRRHEVQEASQASHAADAMSLSVQEQVIYSVSKAYFDTNSAKGQVRAATKACEAAALVLASVDEQKAHGRATMVDLAEAKRQVAGAQLDLTRAKGQVATSLAELVAAVGLPPESPLQILANDAVSPVDVSMPLTRYIDEARRSRPDLQAAQDKVAAADASVEAARAAYRPTIALQAKVTQNIGASSSDGSPYSSINRTARSVLVAFELPLSDGGARSSRLSMALSRKEEAKDALTDLDNTVAEQVTRSYENLKTSVESVRQTQAYRDAANVAYNAALASYRQGLGTVTELTNDEAAMAKAEADQEDAEAQVRIAQAALDLSLGRPPLARSAH